MDGEGSCPAAVIPRKPVTRRSTAQKNKFLVAPKMNVAGDIKVRLMFRDDLIILICGGATRHKSRSLVVPSNIELFVLPPAIRR